MMAKMSDGAWRSQQFEDGKVKTMQVRQTAGISSVTFDPPIAVEVADEIGVLMRANPAAVGDVG